MNVMESCLIYAWTYGIIYNEFLSIVSFAKNGMTESENFFYSTTTSASDVNTMIMGAIGIVILVSEVALLHEWLRNWRAYKQATHLSTDRKICNLDQLFSRLRVVLFWRWWCVVYSKSTSFMDIFVHATCILT